jgi:lysophospholipase L1-like esterase
MNMRSVQRNENYYDYLHPTKKGNAIIADRLHRFLVESSAAGRAQGLQPGGPIGR